MNDFLHQFQSKITCPETRASYHSVLGTWLIFALLLVGSHSVLVSQVHAEDRASENGDWFYTLRPNETLQQVAKRVLNTRKTWNDIVSYNGIDSPSSVQAGSILRIPFAWLNAQPKPAIVMSVTGNVQYKSGHNNRYLALKSKQKIMVGDEIISRDGSALIQLANGAIVTLERDSQVSFNRLTHYLNTGMVDTRLRLRKGGMINSVPELIKGSSYQVNTPSAVAAVRGTEFRLRTSNSSSILEVTEGSVDFKNQHNTQTIPAGKGAIISNQSALIKTEDLYEPPEKQFNINQIDELPYRLSWAPVAGADRYKFELRVEDQFGKIIQSQESNSPEFEIANLKNGNYQLAIRAKNNDGIEGLNDVSRILVNTSGEIAKLFAPLDQVTLDSNSLMFKWQTERPSTQSRLEISNDSSFDNIVYKSIFRNSNELQVEPIIEPGKYHWRVVSKSNGDETFSPSRQFSVQGILREVQILTVNYVGNQVGLFWNTVENSEGYVLQISDTEDFSNIIREETINKPSAFLKLSEGTSYFARVKGLSNDLYRSNYGPIKQLELKGNDAP